MTCKDCKGGASRVCAFAIVRENGSRAFTTPNRDCGRLFALRSSALLKLTTSETDIARASIALDTHFLDLSWHCDDDHCFVRAELVGRTKGEDRELTLELADQILGERRAA